MATAVQKITLSSSRDIPFNKLVLSQSNADELLHVIRHHDQPFAAGACADMHVVRPARRTGTLQLGADLPVMGGRLVALRAALLAATEPRSRAFPPFGFDH